MSRGQIKKKKAKKTSSHKKYQEPNGIELLQNNNRSCRSMDCCLKIKTWGIFFWHRVLYAVKILMKYKYRIKDLFRYLHSKMFTFCILFIRKLLNDFLKEGNQATEIIRSRGSDIEWQLYRRPRLEHEEERP